MKKIILLFFVFLNIMLNGQNLPHYKLTITPAYLDSMYVHGDEEIYFPAIFSVETFSYNVKVRFKGSTSLAYPKKSWAIKFDNNLNFFNASRINLHADYKDHSSMRNFLILNLFNNFGLPTPKIKHVTYEINGEPYGIYTQVEQIDYDFLERNGREPVALYKANNHGGLMAPAVRDDYYRLIWEVEAGGDRTFNDLRKYLNKCLYWTKDDFDNNIGQTINTDNFLTFFAIHFVFVNLDNFTKNIFLNRNSNTQKYELIPWDNEGSFGNSAIGVFDPNSSSYNFKDGYTPEYQVVLKRLLENPTYRTIYKSKIDQVLTSGFQFLDTLIDNTYLRIKQDVYADTKKEATNADFDNSIPQIKSFMVNRKLFLQNNDIPQRYPITNFYCSNPYPNTSNPNVIFRVTSPVVQSVNMFFADSVNFNHFGKAFKFSRLQLYDDGQHDDLSANDLIYGNNINTNNFVSPLIPFSLTGAEQNYPPNGIFYIDYYGSKSYAINRGNIDSNIADNIEIGNVYEYNSRNFVQISNKSNAVSVDLSYYHLRSANAFEDFMFRDNVVLAPKETVYISASKELGANFFPNNRVFFDLYYNIAANDSLKLYTSVLTPVVSTKVNQLNILNATKRNLVFNEINYKSGLEKPSGDWVEIYNSGDTTVNMTNWKYGDSKNTYTFPAGFTLKPDEYIVVAENLVKFKTANPDITNVIGDANFGLSSSGEYVVLLDNIGQLIDSVYYNVMDPWPTSATGTGQTLELKDPILDNNLGENWFADVKKMGSPGKKNFLTTELESLESLAISVYPNPASGNLYVRSASTEVFIEIITLQGLTLQSTLISANSVKRFDISMLAQGIYIVKATSNGIIQTTKLIVK